MTRRILAALVGLTAVLLAAVVVPLGAIAAHHDAQVFVERTEAAALALASQAEERLADEHESSATGADRRARSPRSLQRARRPRPTRGRRFERSAHLLPRPQRGSARPAQRTLDRRPEPFRRRASGDQLRARRRDCRARAAGRTAGFRANPAMARTRGGRCGGARRGGAAGAGARPVGGAPAAPSRSCGGSAGGGLALGPCRRPPTGPLEIRQLAATFNQMAGRLEGLLASQRNVLADVSHQLRTPLAALRLRLELMRQDAGAAPGERPGREPSPR